jgi:hypothetical protein
MYLHTLLILFNFILTTLATVACIQQSSPNICVLTWETNSGPSAPTNILEITPVWAHAHIYSPTCLGWGSTTNGLGMNVKVYAWGLDLANPLVLNSEVLNGLQWMTPTFTYQGATWDYYDCSCMVGEEVQTYACVCPFLCVPETWA